MREITIDIDNGAVWDEVQKATAYAADKSAPTGEDSEAVYDKVVMTKAAADELKRYYEEAISVLRSHLGARCAGSVSTGGTTIALRLNVSERYSDEHNDAVRQLLQGYCVNYICGEWYKDINGDMTKNAIVQAGIKMEAVLSLLNTLSAPTHI